MTDASTRAATLLKGHRDSIDRLDAILVYTLGERFKHTRSVGKLKAQHDLPPADRAQVCELYVPGHVFAIPFEFN